ncbi:MAG: NACHT domain-containing protein [Clostridia bacterium]|nr:NACHT domain-containing protein [Clostridia bacterium]
MLCEIGTNIIYGILTNAIYDITKYVSNLIFKRNSNNKLKKQVDEYVKNNIPQEFLNIQDSGIFQTFISSPQLLDTLNSYVLYKTIGIQYEKVIDIKKSKNSNKILSLDDVLNYLTNQLLEIYKRENTLKIPEKRIILNFLKFIIEGSEKILFDELNSNEQQMLFFVNSHIDYIAGNIYNVLDNISNSIHQMITLEVKKSEPTFKEIKDEYYNILKSKYSEAHIYLLDKFSFESFYVPPILTHDYDNDSDVEWRKKFFLSNRIYNRESWNNIFANRNIIYITGGAGYGKSLFMQKLINDYKDLNIFQSNEYLVIYGELKSFYVNNTDSPLSVVEFLQNSMKTSTLMDESKISREFVEYYLNIGRCIILLDALDEVEKNKREKLHESIISFFKYQNPNNKVCITSRNRGFIPEKDIEVLSISPLDEDQIEKYVDKIIALGKFERSDKNSFMSQAKVLIDKGFLNSFLVLSLLINIYKAELELPENKLELYEKCFKYIANKREKKITNKSYDWDAISALMKDNTFMELADLCYPNNNAVDKDTISETLLTIYKSKFKSEIEAENAIEEFLKFCSDRTELFVSAAEEDKFKFFHRSFFEYFYSQYIFVRCTNENEILEKLMLFDVDSEVFELTVAMLKQKSEAIYQKLIELLLENASREFKTKSSFMFFNILVLSMQVVDDALYREKFLEHIIQNKNIIVKERFLFHNLKLISDIYRSDDAAYIKIKNAYFDECMKYLLDICSRFWHYENKFSKMGTKSIDVFSDDIPIVDNKTQFDFVFSYNKVKINRKNDFYINIFLKVCDIDDEINKISANDIKRICSNFPFKIRKQKIKNFNKTVDWYRKLNIKQKEEIKKTLIDFNFNMPN